MAAFRKAFIRQSRADNGDYHTIWLKCFPWRATFPNCKARSTEREREKKIVM